MRQSRAGRDRKGPQTTLIASVGTPPGGRPSRCCLYSAGEVASLLQRSSAWFYEHRATLLARGMPAPLDLPGHDRWSRAQVDAWLAGHDVTGITGKPAFAAANDAAPVAAPEAAAWEPFLRRNYAQR